MFIISLTYEVPLEEVEPHMQAHMEWVNRYYDQGVFLASGRKVPRTGGVILARGDRASIEACIAEDPFSAYGVAKYEVTEFQPTRAAEGLEALVE
jgi:uncharacterized protein YciI